LNVGLNVRQRWTRFEFIYASFFLPVPKNAYVLLWLYASPPLHDHFV
jgi:hypothetical protein